MRRFQLRLPSPFGSFPALLALALLLGGCGARQLRFNTPGNLQILISAGQGSDKLAQASIQKLTSSMVQEFMRVNPGVNLHLRFVNEADVVVTLRERAALGASPDLIITRAAAAAVLASEGLTKASGLEPQQLDPLRIRFLSRFRDGNHFRALPFLLQPNLACYNRRRVPAAPATIAELLLRAENGTQVGLPLAMDELLWTTTGFRAGRPILELIDEPARVEGRKPLGSVDRGYVLAWLRWLYRANVNPNIQFLDSSEELVQGLQNRQFDWISCNATAIPRLKRALGKDLAVAVLPGVDEDEPAEPMARLLLISFGRDSTPVQRGLAERFALFVLNDFSQNNLMLRAVGNLPVNQNVIVPVKAAPELAAMERSLKHSIVPNFREGVRIRLLGEPLKQLLKETVYGEQSPEEVLTAIEALALGSSPPQAPASEASPPPSAAPPSAAPALPEKSFR
ncbi:MAG: hypothetical protein ACK531_12450 [Cyanobacteriota bacterium]|jgi:maltose-binding protein MalE